MTISADYIITSLQAVYGESVTSADIRGWCAMNGANYQTVTKKLDAYKTGRGKWNLTIQEAREQFEQAVKAPAAIPAIEQNLILKKMIPSSSLVTLLMLKKLFSPVSSIRRSLRVCRVMGKRFLLSRHVPSWDVNSSV